MMPSRIATQDALCIALSGSALRSTATSSDAAGMGMVTTRVTGWANVRVLPRWSVMLMPAGCCRSRSRWRWGTQPAGGAGCRAPGEKGCGSARHKRLEHAGSGGSDRRLAWPDPLCVGSSQDPPRRPGLSTGPPAPRVSPRPLVGAGAGATFRVPFADGGQIMVVDGAQLFVRYAYPPNSRGSCGPPDSDALLHYGQSGVTDQGLRQPAKGFAGAWPDLELIAGATGIPDPLDAAWWRRTGWGTAFWTPLASPTSATPWRTGSGPAPDGSSRIWWRASWPAGSAPQLPCLRDLPVAGPAPRRPAHATALNVLDRCRIRWGEVLAITGDDAVVRSRPLVWDGTSLAVGEPVVESAKYAVNGTGFVAGLAVGDVVSLHWDWVATGCPRTSCSGCKHFTARHLRIANDGVEHRGAAIALERQRLGQRRCWAERAPRPSSGSSYGLQSRRLRRGRVRVLRGLTPVASRGEDSPAGRPAGVASAPVSSRPGSWPSSLTTSSPRRVVLSPTPSGAIAASSGVSSDPGCAGSFSGGSLPKARAVPGLCPPRPRSVGRIRR